jgi:hypothetical protein
VSRPFLLFRSRSGRAASFFWERSARALGSRVEQTFASQKVPETPCRLQQNLQAEIGTPSGRGCGLSEGRTAEFEKRELWTPPSDVMTRSDVCEKPSATTEGCYNFRRSEGRNKTLKESIASLQRRVGSHQEKIRLERLKDNPQQGSIKPWLTEVAAWESRMARSKRRLRKDW